MILTFRSEYGEDRWLFERGFIPLSGTYVDLGAAWPQDYSNTSFLRDLGWNGIQIDGCEVFKPLWDKAGLELIVAVISSGDEVLYSVNSTSPNLSKVDASGIPVKSVRINDILLPRINGRIGLMSIDLEGHEFDVLNTLDWAMYDPNIIIWEYNTLGKKDERLKPFLENRGYTHVYTTECNHIHVNESALRLAGIPGHQQSQA